MQPPRFLTLSEVVEVHRDQIDRYGGSHGLRDEGLLEAAVQAPAAFFGGAFLHGDLIEMASAFLFSLAKNHPFVDGNKRTATAAALVFLALNGVKIRADEPTFSDLVIAVASGAATREEVVKLLREHLSHG